MKKEGKKTARTQSIASNRGIATSRLASKTARRLRFALGQMHMNVFKKHRTLVHEHSYGKGKPAKSHDVNGLSRGPQSHHRNKQRKWDRDDDD